MESIIKNASTKELKQEFMSANTSINSSKLPAIYKKIRWELVSLKKKFIVLDYGCGKYISHIKKYIEELGGEYRYYDPTWYPDKTSLLCDPDIIICASVLNVIKEDDIVRDIMKTLLNYNRPVFFTIYTGDKSGVGKNSKKGCWQRNQEYDSYLLYERLYYHHGVITNHPTLV